MKYWNNEWIRKIPTHLRDYGITDTLYKIATKSMAVLFDMYYGIDTESYIKLENVAVIGTNKNHGEDYHPTAYLPFRVLFNKIRKILPERSTFIDYGCGKGRALLIASEYSIETVKGIDFCPSLCQIAKTNINRYVKRTGTKTDFHVHELDVLDYQIATEDNIFFLFNPFGGSILDQLLDKIEYSFYENPRFMMIIYDNPKYEYLIEKRSFWKMTKKYHFYSSEISVYINEMRGDDFL